MQIPVNPHLPPHSGVQRANGGPPVSFQPPQGEVYTPSGATAAPTEQKIQTRSGLKGTVRQDQMGVAMQATLPAGGGLLPVAVLLQSTPTGTWTAHIGQDFKDQKPTQLGSDGRVYVEVEKGSPAVVFDPRNLDYGLSGGSVQTPTGWQRNQMELIDQNGVRHYVFNESASSTAHGVRNELTEVKWDGRQMTGARVVRTHGGPPPGGNDFGLGALMGNGPENGEVAMGVRMNPDNSMTLAAPTLSQMASRGGLNMLMGKLTGKGSENLAGTFMPFSAMHPSALFPALLGGQPVERPAVQVPPPLPPPPAAAPGMMEQLGFGGGHDEGGGFMEQVGGLFGGQRPQQPQAPPRPLGPPVQFGPPGSSQQGGAPVQFAPAGGGQQGGAPVQFAPAGSVPQGGAPVQFAPAGGGPQGGAPVQFAPAGSVPQGGAPVQFAPAGGGPQGGAPVQFAPAGGGPQGGAPVQFAPAGSVPGQAEDPQQALRARYPHVEDARFQAAWTLSGGNPEKAEQLLQQFGA